VFYEMAATIWREEGISVTEVSHTLSQQKYALRNIQIDKFMPAHKMGVILTTKAVQQPPRFLMLFPSLPVCNRKLETNPLVLRYRVIYAPLQQHHERLCERYGHFVSANGSILVTDPATISAVFDDLRVACPEDAPASLGATQTSPIASLRQSRLAG
jgi:hypothetical protein